MLRPNRTKQVLADGGVATGTLSLLPEPAIGELLGATGHDFLIIDTQHVNVDGRTVENMIRACEASGITPIVRIRDLDPSAVQPLLDAGAQGIVAPLLSSRADADALVEMTHFPPRGGRGLCSASRAAGHGAYRGDLSEYLEHANRELLLVALIETPRGVADIAQIVDSEIDVYFVGRSDLSLAMGLGYAPNHPDVVAASRRVLGTVLEAGRRAAILAYDLEQAAAWIEFGCTFVVYSQPEMVLTDFYRDGRHRLAELAEARTR